jgi:hypothetical protein
MPKYQKEFLDDLARVLRRHRRTNGTVGRAAAIAAMRKEHPEHPLTPGILAAIYRDYAGGGVGAFLEKYRREEAEEGRLIAQAFLAWEPRGAGFANAYAFAAMRLNRALGTAYRAADIERIIRAAGGILELLSDCGVDPAAAKAAARQTAKPRER